VRFLVIKEFQNDFLHKNIPTIDSVRIFFYLSQIIHESSCEIP